MQITTVASLDVDVCKNFEKCKTDRDCKGGRCIKLPGGNPWLSKDYHICKCDDYHMTPTTISSIPTKCNIWTKCQSDSDCNGGNCLPEFGPGGSGKLCSCNIKPRTSYRSLSLIKPLTKSLSTTLRSTPLFTNEIKCVNGNRCETNADCNGGNCFNFFGLPDGKFCKCEQVTSTPLIPTFNPSISNVMLCTQWAKCEYDTDCNDGKCKSIFGIGNLFSCDCSVLLTASPVNPLPSMFCITNNQCETDEQCPGGKCENHKTSGV